MCLKERPSGISKQLQELAEKVVPNSGPELYDVDYLLSKNVLELTIIDSSTSAATDEDCQTVYKQFMPYLEELGWMPKGISLKVSAPGLYRPLRKIEHFTRAEGQEAIILLHQALNDSNLPNEVTGKLSITAKILKADLEGVILSHKGLAFKLAYNEMKKANLNSDNLSLA